MVMEVVEEDMYDEGGSMQYCIKHPFKNTSSQQGGICPFCLQEKLGKLVSSSFPVAIFPSSSSSSSPNSSFRSNNNNNIFPTTTTNTTHIHAKRAKLPFLLTQKKKKKKEAMMMAATAADASSSKINLKRSKSTALIEDYSPQRKGFWSFLYMNHHHHHPTSTTTSKKTEKTEVIRPHKVDMSVLGTTSINGCGVDLMKLPGIRERKSGRELELVVVEENDESPEDDQERRVSRSRSVGCGSRSFSGDFLERISTGFGDCSTLRRVESQREGKSRIHHSNGNNNKGGQQDHCIKERVKCRGIFSGFIITSSSSSSSSNYMVTSSKIEENFTTTRTTNSTPASHHHQHNLVHGRSKSWGWAFASPMRAFSGKRDSSSSIKNATTNSSSGTTSTPNLAAIPSLLAARG